MPLVRGLAGRRDPERADDPARPPPLGAALLATITAQLVDQGLPLQAGTNVGGASW